MRSDSESDAAPSLFRTSAISIARPGSVAEKSPVNAPACRKGIDAAVQKTESALRASRPGTQQAIEVSQRFRPDWLEHIRDLSGMLLVFGYSFLWSDLLCYAAGIVKGRLTEKLWRRKRSPQ